MKKTSSTPVLTALLAGAAIGAVAYANRKTIATAGAEVADTVKKSKLGTTVADTLTKLDLVGVIKAKFGPMFAANDRDDVQTGKRQEGLGGDRTTARKAA